MKFEQDEMDADDIIHALPQFSNENLERIADNARMQVDLRKVRAFLEAKLAKSAAERKRAKLN